MLDLVVHISGKSGSGKDLYANALRIILNEHYTKAMPTNDPDYCAHILAFGTSLKYLGIDLTGFASARFFDRDSKDTPLSNRDIKEALYFLGFRGHVNWKGRTLTEIRHSLTGCRPMPVEANIQDFHRWLFDNYHVNPITPRDILKKLGSDGGIVPSWTWVVAVRNQLEFLHYGLSTHIAIVADTRRIEELVNTDSWCGTRDIPVLRFRLNPWKSADLKDEHITETELDHRMDIKWTTSFSPAEGTPGMVDTLSVMLAEVATYAQFRNALREKIEDRAYLTRVIEKAITLV